MVQGFPWKLQASSRLLSFKIVTSDRFHQCSCGLGRERDSWCFLLHHLPRILSLELIVFHIVGGRGPVSFFYVVSSCSITICWKYCSFLIELPCHFCQKSSDHIWEGLFLGCLFCFVGHCVCFYAIANSFDYCSFIISFEARKCESSNFVLFQDCLAILGPLHFHEF